MNRLFVAGSFSGMIIGENVAENAGIVLEILFWHFEEVIIYLLPSQKTCYLEK
jgi:hypothetical protein